MDFANRLRPPGIEESGNLAGVFSFFFFFYLPRLNAAPMIFDARRGKASNPFRVDPMYPEI